MLLCLTYFHHSVPSQTLLELQMSGIAMVLKLKFLDLSFHVQDRGVIANSLNLSVALFYCLLYLGVDLSLVWDHYLGGQTLLIFSQLTTPLI